MERLRKPRHAREGQRLSEREVSESNLLLFKLEMSLDSARHDKLWGEFLWVRRPHFCHRNKPETNGDEEERKELASREGTDQCRIGFAEIFDYDPKNRVPDKK